MKPVRIRVLKDEVGFLMEVPPGTSADFPLWDPELFDKATVRIGKRAAYPAGTVAIPADGYCSRHRPAWTGLARTAA